jgi:bifunctional DNA-binding transcriptional regulator/antitoxin component of YhaV-PrlF toxin-antitoxin module
MEARKVISIKSSLFINIPMSVAEEFKIQKGDVLWISYVRRYGVVITKEKDSSKISSKVADAYRINIVCDEAFADLRRRAKGLERNFINRLMMGFMSELIKSGWVDLKEKVDKLLKEQGMSEKDKRKVERLVRSKKPAK